MKRSEDLTPPIASPINVTEGCGGEARKRMEAEAVPAFVPAVLVAPETVEKKGQKPREAASATATSWRHRARGVGGHGEIRRRCVAGHDHSGEA